jgi:hypothetical protein
MNLVQLRDSLRFKFQTINVKGQVPPEMLDLWLNRGYSLIAADTLCYEASAVLSSDGINSSYTIIGSGSGNIASDYLAFKSLDYFGCTPVQVDIDSIRDLSAAGDVTGDDPEYYAIFAGKIWFDHIPSAAYVTLTYTGATGTWTAGQTLVGGTSGATGLLTSVGTNSAVCSTLTGTFLAGETVSNPASLPEYSATLSDVAYVGRFTVFYYKAPVALAADTDTPAFPLNQYGSIILTAAMMEYAKDTGNTKLYADHKMMYESEKPTLLRLTETKSKMNRRYGKVAHRL